jgi:hypothetical protein
MTAKAIVICATVLLAGCHGSRWARDDADYAAKYSEHSDNLLRASKQAIDARHVKGKGGAYAGLAGRVEPFAGGGEIGVFKYPTSYLELRGGLSGLVYENDTPISGGVIGAARLQTPTRLAPFVGMGAYAGFAPDFVNQQDGIDNDQDGFVDDADETDGGGVFALVPEAGAHFWLNADWRLTAAASYLATTDGGDDFLLAGITLARVSGTDGPVSQRGLAKAASDHGWKVGDGVSQAEADGAAAPSIVLETADTPLVAPPSSF